MGFFSALNPLTFARKQQAAWNALMAAYTFSRLREEDQQLVIQTADELAYKKLRRSFMDIAKQNGPLVAHNFLVYGLRERGIPPALGNDLWFHIANPFVDCIGAEEVVSFVRGQIEKEHGIQLPRLD